MLTKDYVRNLEERLEDANWEYDKLAGNADATYDLRGEISRSEMSKLEAAENARDELLNELGTIWAEHPELLSEEMQEYFEECDAEAAEYEEYERKLAERRDHNKVRPGDVIKALGITAVIDKILYQEHHEERRYEFKNHPERNHVVPEEWCIEFIDTNGNYRHYRSWLDGGEVILK